MVTVKHTVEKIIELVFRAGKLRKEFYLLFIIGAVILSASSVIIGEINKKIHSDTPITLSRISFEDFPINKTKTIEFDTNSASFLRLSDREKIDQKLDWLVFAVASDRDFTPDHINQTLHDLPPVRYGYNNQIANFEYGETRHINLGNNIVAAIVPKTSTKEKRTENIAHIADEYRKSVGKIPEKIQIFEYDLNSDSESANLTHTSDLKGKDIFNEKYNYYETTIGDRSDLEKFINQVKDVTYAHRDGNNKLVLGGRKNIGRPTQGLSIEDIAALWQSYQGSQGSGFSLDPTYDYEGLIQELEKSQSFLESLKVNGKSFITDADIQQAKSDLAEKNITSYLSLVKRTKLEKIDPNANDSSLFKKHKKEIELENKKNTLELDAAKKQGKSQGELKLLATQKSAALIAKINQLLSESQIVKIDNFLNTPSTYGFQSARYDGKLQGTQVGMTLFYTDLLAKLWALDYQNSTPSKNIPDFFPLTEVASNASSIYQQESSELSNTRLWFGHQDKGFQIADGGNSLLFDRNATRIYAKSANELTPEQETTATWQSAYFLGWWNDRYEEVASYEPQYERLNQIMKWSYLMGWLEQQGQDNSLAFLQTEPVRHGETFPHWVETNKKELKFKSWDTKSNCKQFQINLQLPVCFYEQGYKATTTEVMPLLSSGEFKKFGRGGNVIKGGVSLAEKKLFIDRKALPTTHDIIEPGLRSGIDYENGFSKIGNNGFSFKTREGVIYEINQQDKASKVLASTTIQAAEGMKLRSPVMEVANLKFTSNITRVNDGIQISTTAKGIPVGDFSTTKTPNGFQIGFRSRDIDAGQSLALDLSAAGGSEELLASHPNVLSAYTNEDRSVFYIETKDSTQVLKLTPDGGGRGKGGGGNDGGGQPPKDWDVHAGSAGESGGSNPNYLAWEEKKDGYKKGKTKIVDHLIDQHLPSTPTELLHRAVTYVEKGKLKVRSLVFDRSTSTWIPQPATLLNEVSRKFKIVKKDNAFVFVQDTPSLNNHNWDLGSESVFTSARSKQKIYQITGESLKDFGFDPENLKLPMGSGDYQVSKGSFSEFPIPRVGGGSDEKCEDGIVKEGKCMKVFVVIEAPTLD
jgi:hypothetical protein